MFLQPEYVQIITWNDFGESHYIGPLKDKAFEAFGRGKSPFKYVADLHILEANKLQRRRLSNDLATQLESTITAGEHCSLILSIWRNQIQHLLRRKMLLDGIGHIL